MRKFRLPPPRGPLPALLPLLLLALLAVVCLKQGSVEVRWSDLAAALCGDDGTPAAYVVRHLRLPQLLTALVAGGALSAAGLAMQTVFANPLADPSLLGVSAGAALGAAVALLLCGGVFAAGALSLSGYWLVVAAAAAGAVAVTALLVALSAALRGTLQLLVAGVMVSFAVSAAVSVLSFYASAEGVRNFVAWGLGDFSGVSLERFPLFAFTAGAALLLLLLQAKPLNALLLGADYARNLGVNVRRCRTLALLLAALLCAAVTALCGPVSFVGLAAPHVARLAHRTADHRRLLPLAVLWGAVMAVTALLLTRLPGDRGVLPLSAVTPLMGVPVVIMLLCRQRK